MREQLSRTEEELQEINPRRKFLTWLIILTGSILISGLFYLQILHGGKLREYSENNRLKKTTISAPRGLIFDRNHKVLVDNLLEPALNITPQYIKSAEDVAQKTASIINIKPNRIIEKIKISEKQYGSFRPVRIKKQLSLKQVVDLKLLKWDYPEIDIQETIIRHYPLKENGAHLFGYIGEISKNQIFEFNKNYKNKIPFKPGDWIGKSGLELSWENELRGEDGFSFVEVDVHNRKTSSEIARLWSFKPKKAVPGKHLVLTIDKDLQSAAYNSLKKHNKTKAGAAIVVMKSNGEILTWISYPSYDPNIFTTSLLPKDWMKLADNPYNPLRNKVIQDHYAPGSIFKPITALAALEEELIHKNTLLSSPRALVFEGRTYHDYRQKGHGMINITSAIERSANVFFYRLGIDLGFDAIAKYAFLFNLGQKTNIKLKEETSGLIPTSQWKTRVWKESWQEGENLSHAIGQGFILVTPLQMALLYNTIAGDGKIVKPFIVKKIIDARQNKIKHFKPKTLKNINRFIKEKNFKIIRQALEKVIYGGEGTARYWQTKSVKSAGKTGTAQVMSFSKEKIYEKCSKKPIKQRHHGWFVAFAPSEKPEITVSVLTEHSCSGGLGSAPIARDIIEHYFKNQEKTAHAYTF